LLVSTTAKKSPSPSDVDVVNSDKSRFTALEVTDIPVPFPTASETPPDAPPPVKPAPAVTPVISPVLAST